MLGELLLQREEVLVGLQVRVVLDDGEQLSQGGYDERSLGGRLGRGRAGGRRRGRSGPGHVLEHGARSCDA